MSPERVSAGEEGEGHSVLMDHRQKRCRNQQWRVWREESGCREYQKKRGEYGRVCNVEDSHRDKLEGACDTFIAESVHLALNFSVGLGASGATETEE